MITIPRFQLGAIFLFFFCYAVGLACARGAVGAIEPTITVAMLIGLGQQIRRLGRWVPPVVSSSGFVFARRFAILWRSLVGLTMLAGIVLDLVENAYPKPADIPHTNSLVKVGSGPIMLLCSLIVLCNCIERWHPKSFIARPRARQTRWLALLAVPFMMLVALHSLLAMYLVHWGVSNIEAAQKLRFRRIGVYLTPVDQNLLPFWFGLLALASLIAAAFLLLRFARRRNFACASLWNVVLAVPLVGIAAVFCKWYFGTELRVLSPDLFAGGFEAQGMDWFDGVILALAISGAVAYKFARSRNANDLATIDFGQNPETVPFHQTAAFVAVIGLYGLYGVFSLVQMVKNFANTTASFSGSAAWMSLLYDPLTLLVLAKSLASLHFCWIRWRYQNQVVPWQIASVSRVAWYEAFLATLVLVAVGIPTLHAFTFICWLMPWNLKALFGF